MPMVLKDCGSDLLTHVATLLGAWTVDTNAFIGRLRPTGDGFPQEALFIEEIAEVEPEIYISGGSFTDALHMVRVIILLRGEILATDATRALAKAINQAVHANPPSGYIDCVCVSPTPFEMPSGIDPNGAPVFMTDVTMTYEEA